MDPQSVLVVDDDEIIRATVTRVLKGAGYEVSTHDSGFGFAEAVRTTRPDVVLLDVNMPGLSGAYALRALQDLNRFVGLDVPVVFHSGLPEDQLRELVVLHNAAGYLAKPVRPSEIIAAVARFARPAGGTSQASQ